MILNAVFDIDECAEDLDDCAQLCTEAELGYSCSCRSGYHLASDGRECYGKWQYYSDFGTQ